MSWLEIILSNNQWILKNFNTCEQYNKQEFTYQASLCLGQMKKSNYLQMLAFVMNLGKILFSPMPAGTLKTHLMPLCATRTSWK